MLTWNRPALSCVLVLLLAALSPRALHAQERRAEARFEALLGAGLGFRHTTEVDLAEQAGASGYGAANDASPAALAFEIRGGVLFPVPLELDLTAAIAVGGLAIAEVERRYFGATADIGSSISASAEASPRFAPLVASDLRLLVGPALGVQRMSVSSPAGSARIDLLGVGLDAGARLRMHSISRILDGHLEVVLRARRELPLDVRVQRSADDVLFSGTGDGPAIYSVGLGVSYVFSFHGRD